MADEDKPQNDELAPEESAPEDDSTKQDRALETWGESDLKKSVAPGQDGTLFAVEAHTGQHPMLADDEPSVTDSLKKAKGGGANQATMYGPTTPGSAKVGSTHATQFGPTNAGQRPPSGMMPAPAPSRGPGTMQSAGVSGSGQHAVAPFGGKIVVGTRVGQIEVTGVLGKGGMGEVFRGYHHALDIEVAIKVLPDELSRNDLVRQRFLREARLCVKLDHQNIVRVFNVDEHAGNLFLVMELVEGTDAAHMLKNGGRFKYRRALEIGAACADALGYAQTQGLVHRDVKPHNMLLGAHDGKIKLSDFGLARASASSSHLTMSGQIMGTPHYMSPEQAEAKEVTDKSDVYSLGVTMYHMLTGETPFVGDTPISVAVQHIAKEIMFPEARFAPFPKELVAVLKRMTAKDPTKRCSAKQAAVWLRKLIEMAPSDDIQAAPEAMQTMAPVVRESQAFEAAAKAREERDHMAREAAQTMLATVREQQPAQPQTEQRPASQSQLQPVQSGGAGKRIAAAIIITLLLGGGGAAGWWFTMGPGSQKANGDPVAQGNGQGNTQTNTPPVNTPANQPNTPANNAANIPGSNEVKTPPPAKDDTLVAAKLTDVEKAFTAAVALTDLVLVREKLEELSLDLPKASQGQRSAYDDLKARYEDRFALLSARDHIATINSSVTSYRKLKGPEFPKALGALNTALTAADKLDKLTIPESVQKVIAEPRKEAVDSLVLEVAALEKQINTEVADFETQKKFDKADEALAQLAGLKLDSTKLNQIKARRWELQVKGLHASIDSKLELAKTEDRQFKEAERLIAEAEKLTIPPQLKSAHDDIVKRVRTRLDERFKERLGQSEAFAQRGEFAQAASILKKAGDDLPMNNDQNVRHGNEVFFLGVKEQVFLSRKAVENEQFKEAEQHVLEARKRVDDPGERTVPPELEQSVKDAQVDFEGKRNAKFDGLMQAAEAAMVAKDFDTAGQNIQKVSELPLTPVMAEKRDAFTERNKQALSEYINEQLAVVVTALDTGDFDTASAAMGRVKALKPAGESGAKMAELESRFKTEATTRHGRQLDEGGKAVTEKRYAAARNAMAAMKKIPVDDQPALRDAEKNLHERYLKVLGDDVAARLKTADEQMDKGEFKESRATIQQAAGMAHEEEFRQMVKRKNEDLDARIEATLATLLKEAEDARKAFKFETSTQKLAAAAALGELSPSQLERVSQANDAAGKDLALYVDSLFKQLQDCINQGREADGLKVVATLDSLDKYLSAQEKSRVKSMKAALTGETESARLARLEREAPHLVRSLGPSNKFIRAEQVFRAGETVTALFATADGKYGAAGTTSGKVLFYNLKRGTQLGQTSAGGRKVTAIGINSAGTQAVAGTDNGTVVLFEIAGTSIQERALGSLGNAINGIAYSPDNKTVFVLTRSGEVTRYSAESRGAIGSTPTGIDNASSLALSPDGRFLAVGGGDAYVAVFDPSQMVLKLKLEGPGDDDVTAMSFSADSRQLFAGTKGGAVGAWNTASLTKKARTEYTGLSEIARAAGFSPDGRRVAAIDNEKRLVVWDASNGKSKLYEQDITVFHPKKEEVIIMAGCAAADGTMLIGTEDGNVIHLSLRNPGS